jgi:hypothetical protein
MPSGSGTDTLAASILGVVTEDLGSYIEAIEPVSLSGSISGVPFSDLGVSIDGAAENTLAAVVSGFTFGSLSSTVSGIASATFVISTAISGFLGIEEEATLSGASYVGTGSGSLDLLASLVGHFPGDLNASYEPVPPVDLSAFVQGSPSGSTLSSSLSGVLPSGSITAAISGSGGYLTLQSYVVSSEEGTQSVSSSIDGAAGLGLQALINAGTQSTLNAVLNPSGTEGLKGLTASIASTDYTEITSTYYPVEGNLLEAVIEPIAGGDLAAVITPKVFFIDSSLPINTYPFKSLKAVINPSLCKFSSKFSDLHVSISGTSADDLEASVIAIAGQYALAEDQLSLLIKNKVTVEDWIPLIIDQPAITEQQLPIILTNSPFEDLSAYINGVLNSEDLQASITPYYFAGTARDTVSLIEWVNTKTGERRLVSIYFEGDAINYYYSEDAADSFSFSPDDKMVIVVESYELEESGEFSFLRQKSDVKKCVVDDLDEFTTLDEAVRFAITCSLSQISSDLSAFISAKGANLELNATVEALDSNLLQTLQAQYGSVTNQPDLAATVSGSGGFEDLTAYVAPTIASSTGTTFTNELGERFIPKVVVHGTGKVSIVLTKVISTDTLITSPSPDLSASIVGVDELDLGATVTGTI